MSCRGFSGGKWNMMGSNLLYLCYKFSARNRRLIWSQRHSRSILFILHSSNSQWRINENRLLHIGLLLNIYLLNSFLPWNSIYLMKIPSMKCDHTETQAPSVAKKNLNVYISVLKSFFKGNFCVYKIWYQISLSLSLFFLNWWNFWMRRYL